MCVCVCVCVCVYVCAGGCSYEQALLKQINMEHSLLTYSKIGSVPLCSGQI